MISAVPLILGMSLVYNNHFILTYQRSIEMKKYIVMKHYYLHDRMIPFYLF